MEMKIPFGAYDGEATPFGGPSLEWSIDNNPVREEEISEDARFSVRNLPLSITDTISHIRRVVSEESAPQTSAFVQRICFTVGIPIIERIFCENQKITNLIEGAYLRSDLSNIEGTRDLSFLRKSHYELNLGRVDPGQQALFAKTKGQVAKVKTISEDLGLSTSKVAILSLAAGLSQSVDSTTVPEKYRKVFVSEVKFFEKWLKR